VEVIPGFVGGSRDACECFGGPFLGACHPVIYEAGDPSRSRRYRLKMASAGNFSRLHPSGSRNRSQGTILEKGRSIVARSLCRRWGNLNEQIHSTNIRSIHQTRHIATMAPGDGNDPVASYFRFPKIEHAALNEIRKAVLNYQNTPEAEPRAPRFRRIVPGDSLRHVQF
jgi:hypothetical protein